MKRRGAAVVSITRDMASAWRIVWIRPPTVLGETGNAMVDQFARGDREGPIQTGGRRGRVR